MFYHTLDPTIIKIWIFDIRYYGLMYVIGLLAAYFLLQRIFRERGYKLSKNQVMDIVVYIGFGILIGGRVGYFLFYDLWSLLRNPFELIAIWHGGMSFHGGLIGVVFSAFYISRKFKIPILFLGDILVIPAGIGLMLGRIGNLINGELWGRPGGGILCIDYSKNQYLSGAPEGCRYPSQLFEAMKNLVIFSVLWTFRNKRFRNGSLLSLFLVMYGVMRFFIEFFREPDKDIGFVLSIFTLGQVLCVAMILAGFGLWLYVHRK